MEFEQRYNSADERQIDPEVEVVPDTEILADAATGIAESQRSRIKPPLVSPEDYRNENPYSK